MAFEQKPVILISDSKEPSFETVLDTACEQLQERHIQNSIRRIRELEQTLDRLEKELEEFIGQGNGNL